MTEGHHGRTLAARRRLMSASSLLAVIAVVLFVATWVGYRQWLGTDADPGAIAAIARDAIEPAVDDDELQDALRTLVEQAESVAAGGQPFATPPPPEPQPVKGPDGVLIQPDDPRYARVAGIDPDAPPATAAEDDLSELPPAVALARVASGLAGRLEVHAGWLLAPPVPAEDDDEAAQPAPAPSPEQRARAEALSARADQLTAAALPLADPAAWRKEVTLYASLYALLAAALPLGGGALCYHLARIRGRRPALPERVPAALSRAWRQDRDLRYNGYSAYLVHVLMLALPFVGFHCAHDLGPPGGGGEEAGEEQLQQVQVVEVVRRKLLVNPFSPISLEVPDEMEIEVEDLTERLASAAAGGEGEGEGGYEGGAGGSFTFVAINHGGAQWDEATRSSAAAKFLAAFASRTGVRTNRRPLELKVGDLMAQEDDDQQPALIYLCLSGSAPRFSRAELAFLRRYVDEIGGVILIDAVGRGAKRHADGIARGITGAAGWRVIGRDDALMRSREDLTGYDDRELALSAHDGGNLLGIRAGDGRWGMIYHPGDLVDAWRGAYDSRWQETGFKIGTNVADYAMKRFTRRRRGAK